MTTWQDTYTSHGGRFPTLGFDPAPGNVHAVEFVTKDVHEALSALRRAQDVLPEAATKDVTWRGDAAQAFQTRMQELPGLLSTATDSFTQAYKALADWSQQLGELQRQAQYYEVQASEAAKRVERAKNAPALLAAFGVPIAPGDHEGPTKEEVHDAVRELRQAEEELEIIITAAKRLREQHKELSMNLARSLGEAAESASDEPSGLDLIANGVGILVDGLKGAANEACPVLLQHFPCMHS